MASAAISIDLILPAFGEIRSDLGLAPGSAATAGLVTAFFLGMAVGPIPFGLLADRFGRRWILLATCVLFVGGAVGAAVVPSLHWMLWARFVWGLGAAGLRVIAVATIRDRFVADDMAREMAFAMAVFICVPVVAPALGAGLIKVMPWRGTFLICAGFGVIIALWSLRLPETLPVERRQPLQVRQVGIATMAMVRSRPALVYTLCSVVIFGAFSSYLATSERIIGDVFHRASWFPYVFGGTAVLMGLSSMAVGRNVQRIGLDRLIRWAMVAFTAVSVAMYVLSLASGGTPSFWPFLILLSLVLIGLQRVAAEPQLGRNGAGWSRRRHGSGHLCDGHDRWCSDHRATLRQGVRRHGQPVQPGVRPRRNRLAGDGAGTAAVAAARGTLGQWPELYCSMSAMS